MAGFRRCVAEKAQKFLLIACKAQCLLYQRAENPGDLLTAWHVAEGCCELKGAKARQREEVQRGAYQVGSSVAVNFWAIGNNFEIVIRVDCRVLFARVRRQNFPRRCSTSSSVRGCTDGHRAK